MTTGGRELRDALGALALLLVLAPGAAVHAQSTPSTVTLPAGAQGIEYNAAANRLYVAVASLNQVLALDATSNATMATIAVGAGPAGLAANATTNRLYVASSMANSLTVIDAGNNSVIATLAGFAGPTGLDLNAATNRVYVANNGAGTVSVLDGTTNSIVGTTAVGVGPRDVAVNAATNRVYVSNGGTATTPGNTVTVIDGAGGVVLGSVPVGTRPGVLAVNATTGRVYVANQGGNNVSVVDGSTLAVLATVSVGGSPIGLAVNPTTNHVLVALAGAGEAALIDGATNVVVATVPLGGAPGEVVALPAQGRFVVAGQGSPFALSIVPDAGGAPPSAPAGGASAVLRPLGPLPVAGTVTFTPSMSAGGTTINATLQGVTPGSSVSVAVPLASGPLTLPCPPQGTSGPVTCSQSTTSQPSVGSTVIASVGGQAVAQGAIVPGSAGGETPPAGVLGGVLLAPAPGSSVNGVCNFTASGAPLAAPPGSGVSAPPAASAGAPVAADCLLQSVATGQVVTLALPTAAGSPALLACPPAPAGGTVTCSQALAGPPAPGGAATAAAGGIPLAQGVVAAGAQSLPPPLRATAGALLQPAVGAQVGGIVNFGPGPNALQTAATVALEHLTLGQQPTVNVPMVGAPPAPLLCPAAGPTGQTICTQLLNGTVLAGLPVTVAVGGQTVAQGTIVAGGQPPATGAPLVSGPPPLPPGSPLQPGPLPPALLVPGGPPGAPAPPARGVPVIPEADSSVLLGVGLAALGGLQLWRHDRLGRARRAAQRAISSVRSGGA